MNIFLNGRHAFTPVQADIFAFLVSVVLSDSQPASYDLSMREMTKLTGRAYTLPELRTAVEVLGSRMYTEETPELRHFWLLQYCVFVRGTGILRVWLSPVATERLLDLKQAYSFATLSVLLRLTSRYARLLYLLCLRWTTGITTLPLLELQTLLGLVNVDGPPKLGQISHLRDKVLAPAIRQIQTITGLDISYQFVRKGRTYHTISFAIQQL